MDNFNLSLFDTIHGLSGRSFFLDAAGVFAAQYLPYFLFFGFLWLAALQPGWRRRIFFFSEAIIALILSRGLITEIIRFFYPSARPFDALNFQALIPESGASFPSGHAAFFFALAMVVYFHNRRWGAWYFAFSVLVGLARIFAGVHWPMDIVGGAVVGVLSGIAVHLFLSGYFEKLKEHNAARETAP